MTVVPVTVCPNEHDQPQQLDKRTYLPYVLKATCPKCGREVDRNLDVQYLSYPFTNRVETVDMYCCDERDDEHGGQEGCGCEFVVRVIVRMTCEAVPLDGEVRQ